jgi:hypothetical protein
MKRPAHQDLPVRLQARLIGTLFEGSLEVAHRPSLTALLIQPWRDTQPGPQEGVFAWPTLGRGEEKIKSWLYRVQIRSAKLPHAPSSSRTLGKA